VSELSASLGSVIQTITVGSASARVSSHGTNARATNFGDNTMSEIVPGGLVPAPPSVIIPSNGAVLSGTATPLDALASNATGVEFAMPAVPTRASHCISLGPRASPRMPGIEAFISNFAT
jgi:hypothetical protein